MVLEIFEIILKKYQEFFYKNFLKKYDIVENKNKLTKFFKIKSK